MEYYKRYVDVIVLQTKEGELKPLALVWDNGRQYEVDKVYSTERRASRVGGCGIRYDCRICGARRNLFFERNRWFIESTKP